jgi:hypothetical protein
MRHPLLGRTWALSRFLGFYAVVLLLAGLNSGVAVSAELAFAKKPTESPGTLSVTPQAPAPQNNAASLILAWEPLGSSQPVQLKSYLISDLESRKLVSLTEKDPLSESAGSARFQGVSLSKLVEEATKSLTAAERSTTDLVILRTRTGREAVMPKAFLVKYPQIQIAFKKDSASLGKDSPRVVLPATTNEKITKENILLEPIFVTELASITLSSYERRYQPFFLKRRTDPSAMRGEKLFLQNCVSCHGQPQATLANLTLKDRLDRLAQGEHPEVPGNHGFKSLLDKRSIRSLVSYLEAFRFEMAQN